MSSRCPLPVLGGIVALLGAIPVGYAQDALAPPTIPPERSPDDDVRRKSTRRSKGQDDERVSRLLGVLHYTRISIDFAGTPAREAIAEIGRKSDLRLFGRYEDDRLGYGIDPHQPIDLQATGVPVLEALEEVIAQLDAVGPECTWQIRKGFVEVGTKERLSVPAARETRTYYVADAIMDIPENMADQRQRREVVALEVIGEIVENIEPDAWDYGQIDYDEPVEPDDTPLRAVRGADAGAVPPGDAEGAANAGAGDRNRPDRRARPERRYVSPRKIAIIRYWRDVLIINAPDWIHREIDGYPEPKRPQVAPLSLRERVASAQRDG